VSVKSHRLPRACRLKFGPHGAQLVPGEGSALARRLRQWLDFAGRLQGQGIEIQFQPQLSVHGRRLLVAEARGQEVHAGTFLRHRRIILDAQLLRKPSELRRVFVHEVFHFVWLRLGNPRRRSYEGLLAAEWRQGARGELGWSAEWRKALLTSEDPAARSRRWREYACESFCDTAAFVFTGLRRHGEFTLAARFCELRRRWFQEDISARLIPI